MDPLDRLHARYESIFGDRRAPFAFVDLDALRENARTLLADATGLPIRIASKSVRSTALIRRILDLDPRFRGVLSFTLEEALHLRAAGVEDIFVGYPTTDREALGRLAELAAERPQSAPALIVDDRRQLELIAAASGGEDRIRVLIDLDTGWWPLGGRVVRVGPKRSPLRTPQQAHELARVIVEHPACELAGAMAYEGHIAGVGDRIEGRPLRSAAIRAMQRRSLAELRSRLPQMIAAIQAAAGAPLEIVNCGGTGSLARSATLGVATELTAGSGFFAPALFDTYSSLALTPAACFCLPIVRKPAAGVATALGGGYVASGAPGRDRLPQPYLPPGLRYDRDEAAGEVQTPLSGPPAAALAIGDRVYMRHAKAGELCERFNSLLLVEGDAIVDEVATYRGEGKAFL